MKTLIINGSPRKNGGTSTLISLLSERLNGEIKIIDTYRCVISPCLDCRQCWSHAECSIDDPMQDVYNAINDADNIVIASPIYFAELTGPLLSWASRLQYLWVSEHFRKEPVLKSKIRFGALILVDGGDGYKDTALAMGKRLLRCMGTVFKELVYFSGTDKLEPSSPINDAKTMDEIMKLADILNMEHI